MFLNFQRCCPELTKTNSMSPVPVEMGLNQALERICKRIEILAESRKYLIVAITPILLSSSEDCPPVKSKSIHHYSSVVNQLLEIDDMIDNLVIENTRLIQRINL